MYFSDFDYKKHIDELIKLSSVSLFGCSKYFAINFSYDEKSIIFTKVKHYALLVLEKLMNDEEIKYTHTQIIQIIQCVSETVFYVCIDVLQGEIPEGEIDNIILSIVEKIYTVIRNSVLNNDELVFSDEIFLSEIKSMYDIELKKLLEKKIITLQHYEWASHRSIYRDLLGIPDIDTETKKLCENGNSMLVPLGEKGLRLIALGCLIGLLAPMHNNFILGLLSENDKKFACYYMSVDNIPKYLNRFTLIKLLDQLFLSIKKNKKVKIKFQLTTWNVCMAFNSSLLFAFIKNMHRDDIFTIGIYILIVFIIYNVLFIQKKFSVKNHDVIEIFLDEEKNGREIYMSVKDWVENGYKKEKPSSFLESIST